MRRYEKIIEGGNPPSWVPGRKNRRTREPLGIALVKNWRFDSLASNTMPLNMRSVTFLFFLAVFVAGMSAQTKAPSADVTLAMSADTPEYGAGPMTPN